MVAVRTPLLVFLSILLSLAAPALAGTAAAPEIVDPANDQAVAGQVPISQQPPAGTTVGLNVDILAAWIEQTADGLQLTIKIQGTGAPTSTSSTLYTFHLETGGVLYDATGLLDLASPAGKGTIAPGGVATGAVAAGDSLIVLTVPLANIGDPVAGAVLTNLFVKAAGKSGGQQTTISDRAPDGTAAGTDYVLGGASGPAKTLYAPLNGTSVKIAQGFVNATSATYIYNWTQGPANATFALGVHGLGNATVTIHDAANATVFHGSPRNTTLDLNVTAKAGPWSVQIQYTAFKGNLTLSIAPRVVLVDVSPASHSTSASRTPTSGSTSETKSTPAPGLGLLVAALGAALLARRRRVA